jgi:hypothetical protein
MRILFAGGRTYTDADAVDAALMLLQDRHGVTVAIHGACHLGGLDKIVDAWMRSHGIIVETYPVRPAIDGPWPSAGPRRNARMLADSKPDAGVIFPGGRGTEDMERRLRAAGVPVWVPYPVKDGPLPETDD